MSDLVQPLLRVTEVAKRFTLSGGSLLPSRRPVVQALNGVSLEVHQGETLGVVGESGCGKSTLGRCLVRLMDATSGRIEFDGQDITTLSQRRLRPVRHDLQMVFQDPYSSLNPRRRVHDIIAEPLLVHGFGGRSQVNRRVSEVLELVGLTTSQAARYPREFSGGQRQRIGLARALALMPKLIVADEPVSALDVSIQAQVLNLFADLQTELGLTYVFIAHDLGVVRHVSDRVAVMYLGTVVELSDCEQLYARPAHPYTEALLSAAPDIDDGTQESTRQRIVLAGDVPSAISMPKGCLFESRCPHRRERCRTERPQLRQVGPGRMTACHYPLHVQPELAQATGLVTGG